MKPIHDALKAGPFLRSRAIELGVTRSMFESSRFERLHQCVYRIAGEPITYPEQLAAARLALPADAKLTGISRIQELGLDYGPLLPIHFVVASDLHLVLDGVFLHRTKALAPLVDGRMSAEGAFISYCSLARTIDAIKVGNWLLQHDLMTLSLLTDVAGAHLWRAGAYEALFVANFLTNRSRSLKESETAACLTFAGLPTPEFNIELEIKKRQVIGDLLYASLRLVIEYEGRHHQEDRAQYAKDIDRYKLFRDHDYRYLQVTDEKLSRPRRMVRDVHLEMVEAGYDGPAPVFADTWASLFIRLSRLVGRTGPSAA